MTARDPNPPALKPCPFCGKHPASGKGKPGFWSAYVECKNKECYVRPRASGDVSHDAWNRRAK